MVKVKEKRNHRFAQNNLSAYLDNELSEKDTLRVRAHLDGCHVCRQDLAALRATAQALSELPRMPLPRSFAIPRQAVAEQRQVRRLDRGFAALRTASVAVTITLVMLLSGDQLLARDIIPTPMLRTAREYDVVAMEEPDMFALELDSPQPEAAQKPADEKSAEAESLTAATEVEVEALALPESAPPDTDVGEELTPEEIAARAAAPPGLGDSEAPRELHPLDEPAPVPDDEAVLVTALPEEDITPEEIAAAARTQEQSAPAEEAIPERVAAPEPTDQVDPVRAALRQAMAVLTGVAMVVFGGLVWLGKKRRL